MVKESVDILKWKTKDGEAEVTSLEELLSLLIGLKQDDFDTVSNTNISELIAWLEKNFPKELGLIAEIKANTKEFTPQQIRELIIRTLRKSTSA
jgi:hypothetical protein